MKNIIRITKKDVSLYNEIFYNWLDSNDFRYRDDDSVMFQIENNKNANSELEGSDSDCLSFVLTEKEISVGIYSRTSVSGFYSNTKVDYIDIETIKNKEYNIDAIKVKGYDENNSVIFRAYFEPAYGGYAGRC